MGLVKSTVFLAVILFCKTVYSQPRQEVRTQQAYHIQKIVVVSKDTVCGGYKVISSKGVVRFFDESVKIDSIFAERTMTIYHFERKRPFRRTRHVEYVEIRGTVNVFSEQTDTILNLFATGNDGVSSDVFWAEVKTSYLISLLKQNELIVNSDSLWIVVVPEYVSNPGSQYYIYQYRDNSQELHLSVISFAQGFTPQVVFSNSAKLTGKEQKELESNLLTFDIHNQTNCLESGIFASFVFRSHDTNIGIFRSHDCNRSRVFNFALPFVFTGQNHFKTAPKLFGGVR